MKRVLLITIIGLSNLIVKAEKDSCLISIVDSCIISNDSSLVNTNAELKTAPTVNNTTQFKQPKNTSKSSDIFDFVRDVIDALLPPVWGYYTEDGQRTEGPYFLFDRKAEGAAYVQKQMDSIRGRIRVIGSNEQLLYKQIIDYAGTSSISSCDEADKFCSNTSIAKASAFVYLVGLNENGDTLSTADRNGYRDRAIAYLRDVKAQGLHNIYDYIPFGGSLGNLEWGNLIWRAKELQQLCQAWDMLRWCNNIDPNLENNYVIRSRLNEAAKRIIGYYVNPLHLRANAPIGMYNLVHNNYNLIIGSALASSAICFHDYGTYFWNYSKSPTRWANSAYYNIHKVMWRDGLLFGKKMSKPGGTYGYAEGTHYFMFDRNNNNIINNNTI